MLLSLRVGEVGSLVDVESEAETTFQCTQMGSKDIWVLSVSYMLSCLMKGHKLTLAKSIVSRANFRRRSLLSMAVSDPPAEISVLCPAEWV